MKVYFTFCLRFKFVLLVFSICISCVAFEKRLNLEPRISRIENSTSLNDIFAMFRGKMLYIDIWASWCAPCMKEIKKSTYPEFMKDTTRYAVLFLSGDKDQGDWDRAIRNFPIPGFHIRATDNIRKEMVERFSRVTKKGPKALIYPTHLIVNPDGLILDYNAEGLSDTTTLQLKMKL